MNEYLSIYLKAQIYKSQYNLYKVSAVYKINKY